MEREEAINLIKQVLPCLNIDEKIREGFVTLIPELKESEDERVRKALIDGVRQIRCKNDITQEQMLAYLEKQKEQKPIFKKGDKVIWDDEEFNILDVNETEYNVGGYRVPFSRQNELHPIWQKSAEWSEEFLRLMGITISQDGNQVCVLLGENLAEGIAGFGDTLADAVEEFKKEWRQFDRFRKATWKPSEEQMEALKDAFRKDGCNEYRKVINSLYCDLQKLL